MAEVFNQREENSIVDRALTPLPQPHLTGMKLQGDIALGEFLFNTIDEYGVVWVITDIDGWWVHPEPDMPDIPRGFGDGSYDIKGRYQARIMTLSGSFLTPSPSLVEAARDRLIAATNLVYRGAWLKTGIESDNKRSSFVRLSGAPSIQTTTARGRTDFSIGLKAADPIKYAWNDSDPDGYERVEIPATNRTTGATGIETITNIGNVDVPVNFEISGPVTGPARIYNRTTDKLLYIVSGLRGRLTSSIVNKELSFDEETLEDIVTLTTTTAHGLLQGDTVEISGLAEADLNGDFIITEVPTSTTFKYSLFPLNRAITKSVVAKKLVSNVATVFTKEAHGFVPGNSVFLKDIDSVFSGSYTITAATATSFSFAKDRSTARTVTGAVLVSNIATLTTSEAHGFVEGEDVTIAGLDQNYNGTFTITSVPSTTTFSYSKTRTDARGISSRSMTNDVATITMSSTHGFVANEVVAVSGMERTANQVALDFENPFNGTFVIKSLPTTSSFTYDVPRLYSSTITTTSRSSNEASITVAESIQATVGDTIVIEDVANASYNGTFTVTAVLSSTTYVFASAGANEAPIGVTTGKVSLLSIRPFSAVVAGGNFDIIFGGTHNFIVGENVTVAGLGAAYNGTYTVLDTPQFNVIRLNGTGKPAIDASVVTPPISLRARTGNTVTITTSVAHNLTSGQYVRVVGLETALNGTWIATVTGATTFTYTTPSSGTIASSAPSGGGATAYVLGASVTRSRSVANTADVGEARVSGGLPFAAYASGSATINGNIVNADLSEVEASGIAVKKANIPFTPGLVGALVDFGPDILEVDTLTRDVALNGNYEGARAKLDVLTEFFFLQPGNNEIEFADDKNSTSTGLLKVFYRSGWLG